MDVQMTPAEHEANEAKLRAEAAKALAEADKARAEARQAVIAAEQEEDDERRRKAADDFHHVYRFSGDVSESSVQRCMKKLTEWHRLDPGCNIEIIFSSPGGSIWDGVELFDFLRGLSEEGHRVVTGGIGMAASMAGILLQAGDHRWMGNECWVLIHRAAFIAWGQTQDVEDRVELIKRIEKRIIDIFVTRSGGKLTANKIKRNWERKDWWLNSAECLEYGLVDEVRATSLPVANSS